jgi:[protein-PII] uridylyltransferase
VFQITAEHNLPWPDSSRQALHAALQACLDPDTPPGESR